MDKHRRKGATPETGGDPASERPEGSPFTEAPESGVDGSQSLGDANPFSAGSQPDDPTVGATAETDETWRRTAEVQRDKYVRLAAEFDNYRKRSSRERQEAGWRAQADLVGGIIEALDDLMRFAHLDPSTVDSATVVEGVALVEKKLLKSLNAHGLEVINPIDHPFDPAFHEAVGTEPALSREDDHLVARVYQAGFVFRGQLLRPARVVVKQWLG